MAAVCDLVVAKVRERLAVNKQSSHRFHMGMFNHKKLNVVEGIEQFRVEIANKFTALESLETEVELTNVREMIRENINISAKWSLGCFEMKKCKPWFDKGCSKL
jgi:hypothetical protein